MEWREEDSKLKPLGMPKYKVFSTLPKQLLELLLWEEIFGPIQSLSKSGNNLEDMSYQKLRLWV